MKNAHADRNRHQLRRNSEQQEEENVEVGPAAGLPGMELPALIAAFGGSVRHFDRNTAGGRVAGLGEGMLVVNH
jgi:hypothetical protein